MFNSVKSGLLWNDLIIHILFYFHLEITWLVAQNMWTDYLKDTTSLKKMFYFIKSVKTTTVYTHVQVIFLGREKRFSEAEGKMFSAILATRHYRIQPDKSQSQNKIVTSLSTNPLLFNK